MEAVGLRVPQSVEPAAEGSLEGVIVRSCQAYRRDGVGPVADPIGVGVGVQGVGARVRAVDVGSGIGLARVLEPVPVVVRVLDEGRDGCRGPGDSVRHAVAVGVRVRGRVQREGVGACLADAGHCLRAVAVPVAVRVRAGRVVAHRQLVEVGDPVVVVVLVGLVADAVPVEVEPLSRVEGECVRASLAYARDLDRAVAVTVVVRVGVERVSGWVGGCLGSVVEAVAVVVLVGDESGGRPLCRVVVPWQLVGKAVAVRVSEADQAELDILGGGAARRGHCVGGVGKLPLDGPRDLPRGWVHREVGRQGRGYGPGRGPILEGVVEADRIDRLILHHGVRVVRAHAEVDLEGGCLSALLRMYRVGLVAGVDRGRAADGAARDADACRQSWLGPPRGGWRRVEGDVRGVVGIEFEAGCAGGVPQRVVGGEVNGAAEESEAE